MKPSIRELVREMVDTSPAPHPKVVADQVIAALPKSRYEEALHECLWLYVRSVSPAAGQRAGESQARPAGGGRSHEDATQNVRRMGATRLAGWLRTRVSVADGTYKFLGDCNVDDVAHLAVVRREHEAANAAAAARFERLAGLMQTHRAKTVADLPAEVIAEAA